MSLQLKLVIFSELTLLSSWHQVVSDDVFNENPVVAVTESTADESEDPTVTVTQSTVGRNNDISTEQPLALNVTVDNNDAVQTSQCPLPSIVEFVNQTKILDDPGYRLNVAKRILKYVPLIDG